MKQNKGHSYGPFEAILGSRVLSTSSSSAGSSSASSSFSSSASSSSLGGREEEEEEEEEGLRGWLGGWLAGSLGGWKAGWGWEAGRLADQRGPGARFWKKSSGQKVACPISKFCNL